MEKNVFTILYNEHDKKILKVAEDSLNPQLDRVQEIIEYAREAGLESIGIANCTTSVYCYIHNFSGFDFRF
jgi:uncharacterized metal-binding protein